MRKENELVAQVYELIPERERKKKQGGGKG